MLSRHHRWVLLTMTAAVWLPAGCRGTRPYESVAKVTKTNDAVSVDPPQQRLAINKPRRDGLDDSSDSQIKSAPPVDHNPHAVASSKRPESRQQPESRQRPSSDTVSFRFGDQPDPARNDPAATPEPPRTTAAKPPTGEPAKDPDAAKKLVTQSDEEMIAAAIEAAMAGRDDDLSLDELSKQLNTNSEEFKELVLFKLAQVLSESATRTSQPAPLTDLLAVYKDETHELPPESDDQPKVPPTRIAAQNNKQPTASTEQSRVASDEKDNAGKNPNPFADTSLGPDQSAVKAASATQDSNESSPVAQAGLGYMRSSDSAADLAQFSTAELYAELVLRRAQPREGETESERTSRLFEHRNLLVLAGDPDAAADRIGSMPVAQQEYLRHSMLALWEMLKPDGHPVASRRFTSALPAIREAAKYASAATDSLELRRLAFCTEIESYGQIKTFAGNHFDSGQQVILYCEIENFTVAEQDGGFETNLQGSYEIYNENDEKVVSQLLPADKQVSQNYLRDYFIAYQMHLPQQLPAGAYRLQLTMEDVSGKKYGQESIPLEINKTK